MIVANSLYGLKFFVWAMFIPSFLEKPLRWVFTPLLCGFQQNEPRQNSAAMSIANAAFLYKKMAQPKKSAGPGHPSTSGADLHVKRHLLSKPRSADPLRKVKGMGRKMRDAFHSSLEYVEGVCSCVHNSSRYC